VDCKGLVPEEGIREEEEVLVVQHREAVLLDIVVVVAGEASRG